MNAPTGDAAFESARTLFLEGVRMYEAGRFADAEQRLQASLALLPGRASTLVNLGATRRALGRPADALPALEAALAAAPDDVDAWCHHGLACGDLGRDAEAATSFARALALAPRHAAARYHLAVTLNRLHRHAEALETLQPLLVADDPAAAGAWMLAGQTLQSLGRHDDALAPYRRAFALDPALGRAGTLLGQLLQDRGQTDEAAAVLEAAIAAGADPDLNRYLLSGLRGTDPPAHAPAAYVRSLFDPYADAFDAHLVQTLRYRGHEAVVHAAAAAHGHQRWRDVLDLGCGTGLCGPLLGPLADRLEGVDLSPAMLERAHAGGCYDTLVLSDLAAHLGDTPRRHDLVVAADVFIYVGDLMPVFAGVRRVLEAGGLFVFSVETTDAPAGIVLLPSLRYAHSDAYVRACAAAHGFTVVDVRPTVLREEQQRPIDGLIVSLRAAGGSSVCVRPADRQSARDRPNDALPGTGSPCRARARRHCASPRCRSRHGDGRCA